MVAIEYRKGLHLPAADLWLDPWTPRDRAFVSHAHSDHTGRHRHLICTAPTARLMQARMGGDIGQLDILPFGEKRSFGPWAATLYPAGHVLGSAQLLYEDDRGSLLYTGDFKLRKGLSSEVFAAPQADTLVMETTYGLPHYKFPPAEEVIADVLKFCTETLEDGETPVLLGYALGKAQEILSVLHGAGLPIMLHGSVHTVAKVYEEFGITFPAYEKYDPEKVSGHVLICPPSANGSRQLSRIKKRRVAVLTGWALDAAARYRLQVDAAFPLSDHAGYDDLVQLVETVQPRRVLTLHGFAQEFARDLRTRGIDAWALTGANQLEFSILEARKRKTPEAIPLRDRPTHGFERFCSVCERIRQSTGKLRKIRFLATYLRALPADELPHAATWLTGRAFPPHEEKPVNVGWSIIHRALSAASQLSMAELRTISRRHNDAGLTATEALAHHPGEGNPAIGEIHSLLLDLHAARGPIAKTEILTEAFRRMPPIMGGYLVRILTGDLRIGLKEGLVEEAVAAAFEVDAADVREAAMLLGDIGRAATLASEKRLEQAELTIFQPIKCMLASPEPGAAAIWDRLGGSGRVWLEDKLDGIRAQIHITPERVEIYTRDLKRITDTFPEVASAALRLRREAVFDGEILAWENGTPLSFFELQKRLGRREADLFLGGEIPVAYMIFDLLQLDGRSLLKKPLTERRSLLQRLPLTDGILAADVHTARSAEEIEETFRAARARGNEGLMAKDPTSIYSPGRRGLSWLKLKKEFATLDVIVVAVEYGHGRRSNVLSDYTFAVRDEASGHLLPIGKAYSGLTDAEIEELTEIFLTQMVSRTGNRLEVDPRIVIEVAFDAIQPSDRHASGLALRFPRIKRLRPDKAVGDIDTLATARRLAGLIA